MSSYYQDHQTTDEHKAWSSYKRTRKTLRKPRKRYGQDKARREQRERQEASGLFLVFNPRNG